MDIVPMYGFKMPAKYWDLVSMYRGPLGLSQLNSNICIFQVTYVDSILHDC